MTIRADTNSVKSMADLEIDRSIETAHTIFPVLQIVGPQNLPACWGTKVINNTVNSIEGKQTKLEDRTVWQRNEQQLVDKFRTNQTKTSLRRNHFAQLSLVVGSHSFLIHKAHFCLSVKQNKPLSQQHRQSRKTTLAISSAYKQHSHAQCTTFNHRYFIYLNWNAILFY